MANLGYLKYSVAALLILGVLVYWLRDITNSGNLGAQPVGPSALSLALNTCENVADKSVVGMQAIVEFQKLEIAGRRIRVLQNCMNDQGFIENVAWVAYAQPLAQQSSRAKGVSTDEAYENFRRAQMTVVTAKSGEPLYWISKINN
jgi:hypothetical protein